MTQCKIRTANIIKGSLVNGDGLRYTIFTQGCPHHCDGCHSSHTWNPNDGHWVQIIDMLSDIVKNKSMIDGVTFSGGEPLLQYDKIIFMCKLLKMFGLNIWLWSGYKMEQISVKYPEILKWVDVIIDGSYEKDKPTNKEWRGSSNQKLWKRINGRWSNID